MRQAGLKPKSHSSGVYWTRANAKSGGDKTKARPEPIKGDLNGDGIIDDYERQVMLWKIWARIGGLIMALILGIIGFIGSFIE